MKKSPSNTKKLGLHKDTLRALQGRELATIQGGMIPATRHSQCTTACTDC